MPFPQILADAQRRAAEQSAIELLVEAEDLYSRIAETEPHLLNISASRYAVARAAAQRTFSATQTLRDALREETT